MPFDNERHPAEKEIEEARKKKPFYEVILEKMESKIPHILCSQSDEMEMKEFGEVLGLSEIPEIKKKEIAKRILAMAIKSAALGSGRYTNDFLLKLAEEIKK